MKTKSITITPLSTILGAALTIAVILLTGANTGSNNRAGTYQIEVGRNADVLYVLDTRNGDIWKGWEAGSKSTPKLKPHMTID